VRYDDTGDAAIWIVKLAPDGSAMTSFGNGGRLDFQPVKSTWPGDIAVDNDGNLYVSFANATQNVTMGVAKFDRDGKSVASFGNAGIWSGSRTRCHAWKPAVDSSGFVWVAGECTDASGAFSEALVKLDANGRPVPEFGNAGYLDGFLGPVANKSAESIALRIVIAPEGSMYLNGYVVVAGCAQRWLVALDSQGKRIPSFGTDGTMLGVWSVALDAANRLYVASVAPNCPAADQKFTAVLSRYL
jgi:hypothetical protein